MYHYLFRFRVTHHDKKLHGGPNPLVSSGDQLDQSQDSEDRKESGYNLRNMFKDVGPPSESSNGVAPNVGKRKKSLTIFGLRRGSDPAGIKVGEGTGRETGGVRFAIQQQPVVLEELSQTENIEVTAERDTQACIKPETKPSKRLQHEAKTLCSVISPSSQSKIETHDAIPAAEYGSKDGPSPETCKTPMIKHSNGSTAASAPSSLLIPSPASSGQAFKAAEKQGDIVDVVLKNKEAYDPGPLQTSTPIAPMPGILPGFTPVIPTGQPERYSSTGFPVTQTPPDPSSGQDLEPGFRASLALISLGSSPPSSSQIKTPSSVSSLKTPTSPLCVTPSPKLNSRNTPSEATKTDFPSALTPSPNFPSGQAMSSQSPVPSSSFGKSASPLQARTPSPALTAGSKFDTVPVFPQTPSSSPADQNLSIGSSPRLTLKSESVTSVTSMDKGDKVSSPLSTKEQEPEGARILKTEQKTEIKRVGVLAISAPTDKLCKDRLSNLPLSPTSPIGSRVSNVTIVKASPNSKREFSVVTMVEEEESSTSTKDQQRGTSELGVESEKVEISPTVLDVGQPESQHGENLGTQDRPTVSLDKDDMVEMEDIRDCKVTQMVEAKTVDE